MIFKIKYTYLVALITIINFNLLSQEDNTFEKYKNLELMGLIYQNIDMYYVDNPPPGELMKSGIDAMLKSLDPYTVYYPESNIEDYKLMTTGQYGGIGAVIRKIDDYVVIAEPYKNNPAYKAGLLAGDKILKVDGKEAKKMNPTEVSKMLKGQKGTSLIIEVERPGVGNKTITVERDEIKIPDVSYAAILKDSIGYIKLNSFTQTAHKEVLKAYKKLQSEGMNKFILDLRNNGGGLLFEAVKIANMFVKRNQIIVTTKGKVENKNHIYKTRINPIDLKIPIVVLVNKNSASASEIVAGSLQDLDRGIIVGNRTYGKGLVQQTLDLKYGAKMKVTISKYYTPSGRCIQKLDYSKKGKEVSDSLVKKFKTKNGRDVIDARGIEPEFKIDEEKLSRLTATLIVNNLIFNYATKFKNENDSINSPKTFSLTDKQYNDFITYLENKEYEYSTASQELLEKLEKTAKKEKYLDNAKEEYTALLKKLTPSKKEDLIRFKEEIKEILEDEIIGRYYYQKGRAELALKSDSYVKKAIEILNNSKLYNSTLKNNVK